MWIVKLALAAAVHVRRMARLILLPDAGRIRSIRSYSAPWDFDDPTDQLCEGVEVKVQAQPAQVGK
jgi:hypothetical protein